METPPPYAPPAKPKRNTGLIIGIIIAAVVLCCLLPVGLLFGGGLFLFNKGMDLATCAIAMEDVRDAVVQYAEQHDGNLPPSATWQADIRELYQQQMGAHKDMGPIKLMSAEGEWGCKAEEMTTGFAYNADVAGKKLADVRANDSVIIFEVPQRAMNQAMPYKAQDPATAPKIMGNSRGWFLIKATGDPIGPEGKPLDMDGNSGVKIETN